ncbi:MAG: signal peptidase I [Treponema sp.]|nr:signal peptidase I [Treponema sp.]
MFTNKSLQYSVAAQKRERYKLLRIVFTLLILFILYNTIHTFLFSVWVIRNDSMQPSFRTGDRFLVISSTLPFLFSELRRGEGAVPYNRGSVVLIDKSRAGPDGNRNPFILFLDSFVRFFTAQQVSVFGRAENLYIKRLIALPGDEVNMVNFVMRVRPAGDTFALTEFELANRPYYPTIPQVPALWDITLPLSGNMESIQLGPGECFVMSDDRGSTADSRTWGPICTRSIIGRPVLRFWPPARIGFP